MKRLYLIRFNIDPASFEGGNHSVYVNRSAGKTSTILRHREINDFLA